MEAHVLTLLHPARIVRDGWALEPFQIQALTRLRRWLAEPEFRARWPQDMTSPLPPEVSRPSKTALLRWLYDLPTTSPEGVAVDIEAAGPHVRLIGLARWDEDYRPVLVREQGGAVAWSTEDLTDLVVALDYVFRTVPLWMQNGQAYDVPELEALGFTVEPMYLAGGDTIIMARYAYPEAPAGLQHLGIVFGMMSAWKHLSKVREEDEQEGK